MVVRGVLVVALAVWLAAGVGGKVVRYAPEREPGGPRAERAVREVLAAHGWTFSDRKPLTEAGMYSIQSFAKAGCDRRIEVVVLGASNEAFDVVLDKLGPDTAFFNDGRFTARPLATAVIGQAVRGVLSLKADRITPTLAVSPAPVGVLSSCSAPRAVEWGHLGS
jgi:hypothetical protein